MKKTGPVLALAGALTLGLNANYELSKYKPDQIWSRQTTMIERFIRPPQEKLKRIEQLRAGLRDLERKGADQADYCKFQLRFDAVTRNKDVNAAEAEIAKRSFTPYSECESDVRLHDFETKGLNIAGALAFVAGLASMAVSLFRRKKPGSPKTQDS